MKTLHRLIILAVLISILSCEKKVNISTLTISKERIEIPKEGGTAGFVIQTDADSWKIDNPASDWLTLSSTSENQKIIDITLNVSSKTIKPRIDTLTITASNAKPVKVIVSQLSSDFLYSLSANVSSLNFKRVLNSSDISITTDASQWNISSDVDWVQFSQTTGNNGSTSVNVTALENTGTNSRKATIAITAENAPTVQISVSQNNDSLTVNTSNLSFKPEGDSTAIHISTDASQWSINYNANWLQVSKTTGSNNDNTIKITALENKGNTTRTTILNIVSAYTLPVQISVSQKGSIYPSYNLMPIAPDASGMNSTAMEIASKINAGWNIGNTMEAIGGETAWGNPQITNEFIKFVKQSGFNAIRIPCSWNQYADQTTAKISDSWLNRVKQVVQYCVNNDVHVILNIHWDGGWLETNCTTSKQVENNAKQKAFWQQIATYLRDFDEHLLFASANEPNVSDATQMAVLLSYHQTFIDAVRSTGGKNAYRVLVVQGPMTDIETTNKLMSKLPTDNISNRLMVEIHYYTPYNFTGLTQDQSWGNQFYYWGKDYHSTTDLAHNPTWGEESTVNENFKLMKTKFVDKGIPVIMGEYGCGVRSNLKGDTLKLHKAGRAYYFKYVTQQAKANGILPFFWDTGGMLDRKNNTVLDQQALDALIQGATL